MASEKYEEGEEEDVHIFYDGDDGLYEQYEDADDGCGQFDDDACEGDDLKYLIVRPEKAGVWDLFNYGVRGDSGSGSKFLEISDENLRYAYPVISDNRWTIIVSVVARKLIAFFGKPLAVIGFLLEFVLNLLYNNGGLFGLICRILCGKVVIPWRGSANFVSTIGHLDGRIELNKSKIQIENSDDFALGERDLKYELGDRALTDLCIMASELAYENAVIIRNVVLQHWKMHFVDFYDCWNDFQRQMSTQVFILCDKPQDANLVLISFRGTEPFDADDWGTDFDYSWYEDDPYFGKVHMGFLEALGLGNRERAITFRRNLQAKVRKSTSSSGAVATADLAEDSDSNHGNEPNELNQSSKGSSGEKLILPNMVKRSAYYVVRRTLRILLKKHKNAKFVVTGHSLGGALAILFPTVLVRHEENEMLQRLLGVYTFGQPRIGNRQLGRWMGAHLNRPVQRYFRVVYCNDLVPRLPYDDETFLYKHFGMCLYFDGCYNEMKLDEQPNPNFFGLKYFIPLHLNAFWELIRSLFMGCLYGPDYKEGWFSILFRVIGLVLPGVSAHVPRNYVNSIRLGSQCTVQMSPF